MRSIRRHATPSDSEESEISHSPRDDDGGLNYQSFPENEEDRAPLNSEYRGFVTSINDMFVHPENERVDCCALACCGILQGDRDRYLVTGTKPPSCRRRFWIHFVLPIWIFILAMLSAVKVSDPFLNEILSTGFVFTLLGYFIIQCLKGTWKRREVRKELLWSKYNMTTTGDFRHRTEDDSVEGVSDRSPPFMMGQSKADVRNAHALCGCYAADQPANSEFKESDKITICTRIFQCFSNTCCGKMCGMHLQLCGVCATAQEGRQLEALLYAGYRRVDYITMQSMMEYYPNIYKARYRDDQPTRWWDRLSSLSQWILGICLTFLVLLLIWSLFASKRFGPKNFLVFCATLLQAYALLKLVHWNHTKDISTDALVKYFAAGFCLSTTLAVFFEMVVGLTLRLVMSLLMAMSGIDVVEENGFSLASSGGFGNFWIAMQEADGESASYRDYLQVYGKDHPFVYTIYLFVNAFFLAALIEELCKYFGYRMVEHPDFLSKRELQEAAECYDEEFHEGSEEPALPDFAQQDRSLESRGAAITVAMVAASLGFACCENLVYIFVYGEATFSVEIIILLARSLFPVHPIAAALQSIRVCQRDLEKDGKSRVGRIIFPSLLFHGFYDFSLMWLDFMGSKDANYIADDDEVIASTESSDGISLVIALLLIVGGLWYYRRQSRRQRERLRIMDQEMSVDQSRLR